MIKPYFIDTHAHLVKEDYSAQEIIEDMERDNLGRILAVGYDKDTSEGSFDLAKKHKNVYCAVGVHPHYSKNFDSDIIPKFLDISRHPKCAAIGEIGLDYHYPDTDKRMQKIAFEAQIQLVKEAELPVIFHLRDAYEDMLHIVESNLDKLPQRGVLHCFSGSFETAMQYADMGFYISFSGALTFKNAKSLPEIIKKIPRNKVLAETDCPYLSPEPFRGRLNYPRNVAIVVEKIAALWEKELDEVKQILTENTFRLFPKMSV